MARFNLPDVTFADKSAQQIETDIITRYQKLTGQTLSQADPRRKFIQAIVLIIAQQRSLIDFSAKQNLLAYASGDFLDDLGGNTDTRRLPASPAVTTLRFVLSTPQQQPIPAGTRATAGDGVFFATVADAFSPGQTEVDVLAQCTVPGTVGNGYLVGEINQLVDPIQWVQSVSNITVSQDGADVESDDAYALRIHEAPESFSVAGPSGAYEYWAKTASASIIDVLVRSPSDGVVEIRPLLQGGIAPDQSILDAVAAVCNDRTVRPLTDKVQVVAPEQVTYNLTMTYWILTANASAASSIQAQVNQAVEDYKLWQRSKMGRAIDPSELIARVKNAGAKRVQVDAPAYQAIEEYQFAVPDQVSVNYGGLEDD